jgi:hypothetical protein
MPLGSFKSSITCKEGHCDSSRVFDGYEALVLCNEGRNSVYILPLFGDGSIQGRQS